MMSNYRRLVLFVEGDDDVRFAETILSGMVRGRWDHVQVYPYAQRTPSVVNKYVGTIRKREDWDYLFLGIIYLTPKRCHGIKGDELWHMVI